MKCYGPDNAGAAQLIKAAQAAINATIMMNQGGLSEHFGGCVACTQSMMAQAAIQLGCDIISAQSDFSDELRVSLKQRVMQLILESLEVHGVQGLVVARYQHS